jgi:DNA-binding IclR family transcriptional regulator
VSRERGYAVSAGETIEGTLSIAAPLGWLHGLAAYSITGPQARFGPRRQEAVAQTLLEEMERLQSAMADGRRRGRRPRWRRLMQATR